MPEVTARAAANPEQPVCLQLRSGGALRSVLSMRSGADDTQSLIVSRGELAQRGKHWAWCLPPGLIRWPKPPGLSWKPAWSAKPRRSLSARPEVQASSPQGIDGFSPDSWVFDHRLPGAQMLRPLR